MDIVLKNLETQNRRLQGRLQALADEAEKNEGIFRRFQLLELQLLTAASLAELIARLVDGAMASLGLDDVTLVLHDPEHEVRHLLAQSGVPPEALSGVLYVDNLKQWHCLYSTLREPWLGPFLADHRSLFSRPGPLASVAILPLVSQGLVFGSLNLGSTGPKRYTRHHATDFHSRLAVVAALCLENAINRERLVISGLTDVLTGWHNRRLLLRRLPEEVERARRYHHSLSALLLDVDHFKRINDTWGHAAGDCVLRDLAARVRQQLRGSDLAARYGGEEFAVVLPQTTQADATQMAERIRRSVAHRPFVTEQGQSLEVTLSVGVAELSPNSEATDVQALGEALLARADAALYRAKAEGRNRTVCDD